MPGIAPSHLHWTSQYFSTSVFRGFVCVCVCIHRMKMVGSNREITYSPVHCGGNPKICLFVRSLFHTPIEYEHMSLRVCACVCVWIYYIHSLIHTFIIVLVYISIFGCIAICMILSRLLLVPTAVHSFFFSVSSVSLPPKQFQNLRLLWQIWIDLEKCVPIYADTFPFITMCSFYNCLSVECLLNSVACRSITLIHCTGKLNWRYNQPIYNYMHRSFHLFYWLIYEFVSIHLVQTIARNEMKWYTILKQKPN